MHTVSDALAIARAGRISTRSRDRIPGQDAKSLAHIRLLSKVRRFRLPKVDWLVIMQGLDPMTCAQLDLHLPQSDRQQEDATTAALRKLERELIRL